MTKEYKKYVEIALRAQNISIPKKLISQVVATVELIQVKGGKATLKDTCKLSANYKQ